MHNSEETIPSDEKPIEPDEKMLRGQELLMKSGLTAGQADHQVKVEGANKPPINFSWSHMHKAIVAILGLALVATIVYSVVITRDRDALNTELMSVKSVLISTQSDLASTKSVLASTESDFASTKWTLALTQVDLTSTQADLDSTKSELNVTQQTLASTQADLNSLNDTLTLMQEDLSSVKQTLASVQDELDATTTELETTRTDLNLYRDTLGGEIFSGEQPPIAKAGLSIPREYVDLIDNPITTNPTWSQLKAFLRVDSTDNYDYNALDFNCTNFAERLHNRAEAKGIRAAFVAVTFIDEDVGHTLNAFKTTDKGLVYVDCTGGGLLERLYQQSYGYTIEYDKIAYVVKGKECGFVSIDRPVSPEYSYYEAGGKSLSNWLPMGIVESITIYW